MPKASLSIWRSELLATGRIVQDEDLSVTRAEAESGFNRYVQMIDELDGSEGLEAALALVQSIQMPNDYGAYERTLNALLFIFPPSQAAAAIVSELPRLIATLPEWAGNLLSSIARSEVASRALLAAFNTALALAPTANREKILAFVHQEEVGGWLEDRQGLIRPVGL